MKKLLFIFSIVIGSTISSFGQSCEEMPDVCVSYLDDDPVNQGEKLTPPFVSDGQVYRVFLDGEDRAEFKTTFYGKTKYRIAVSAGTADKYVLFVVRDQDNNELFSNMGYENAQYWDFYAENTINVTIETFLDVNRKESGCAVVLIGFQK